ncbi:MULTISPECIES: T9SS type A sorting domain-containing protein [Flavobacterium]|uniref:T9SS type A sorting domain-containing protein n=1 Tax=Flavobacterium TaxID=237 RepID=UPI001FCADCC9|nr:MULTISPECIES: T9SS type A sorting domain-containing protein [Flavobacterium]UOK43013.1 T9SS type A sorting domain-containing protein [Flavobacterium enshiense]
MLLQVDSYHLGNIPFEPNKIVSFYPNPVNDRITIQLSAIIQLQKAEIYNTLGQFVATETNADFTVNQLSNGVHPIKIKTSKGVIQKNFIKK